MGMIIHGLILPATMRMEIMVSMHCGRGSGRGIKGLTTTLIFHEWIDYYYGWSIVSGNLSRWWDQGDLLHN